MFTRFMLISAGVFWWTQAGAGPEKGWQATFPVERSDLASSGRNEYFILEPGYSLTLQHGAVRLLVTVTQQTKMVDGVETRVVEEIETDRGRLVERSRNYLAISRSTRAVYYFGEDVDMYAKGRVTGHDGSWLAGQNGAKFGLAMPGSPHVADRYYQEIAPRVAMDRARIVSITDTLTTPAGRFPGVLTVEETTQLESGKEYKRYARGIGLIQDGDLKLVARPK